ncbi:MAG: hypothetical protein HY820_20140 [Acidobacteria bacterium]|nr:hypothetical protein [Acidobacteriota bacterium]
MPHSFLKSAEDAIDLLRLPDGWNSYSAKPVPRQTVIRAVCLLAEFLDEETPTPSVVPTVRGGIQIEWHTKGFDIEIYVESATSVSFYAEHLESGESCETPLAGNHHLLRSWLERISGK